MTDFSNLPKAFTEEWRHALIAFKNEVSFLNGYINALEARITLLEVHHSHQQPSMKNSEPLAAASVIEIIKEEAPELLNRDIDESLPSLEKDDSPKLFEPIYKKKKFTDKMKDLLK